MHNHLTDKGYMQKPRLTVGMLFLLFLVVIAVGCSTSPTTQPTQSFATPSLARATTRMPRATLMPTPPQDWLNWSRRWLNQIPCSAPCWENVTPNKTTVREAINFLLNLPIIAPDSVQIIRELCGCGDFQEMAYSRRLVWQWTFTENSHEGGVIKYVYQPPAGAILYCGIDVGVIEVVSPDETTLDSPIYEIDLEFLQATTYAYNISFRPTLGDVINAYGQPSYIVAVESPEFSWYNVNIIYASQGLVLKKVARSRIALDENMDFGQAVFSDKPFRDGIEQFDNKVLIPWQGIRDFTFYCRYENGSPCN
jgi:hypothetical protein